MSAREPDSGGTVSGLPRRSDVAFGGGGRPMRVLVLDPRGGTRACCAGTDGIPVIVETALVRPLEPGAILLVSAGIALVRLDAEWVP